MFSVRYSHQYFSNVSRLNGGFKNDLLFHLFAMLKPLDVVEYNEEKCGIDYSNQMVSYATTIRKGIKWYRKFGEFPPSGNFCCKHFDGLQNCNKEEYKYYNI